MTLYVNRSTSRELIDTLWNVNKNTMELKEIESRINRYIMECKFSICSWFSNDNTELIDTLWNVNFQSSFS